MNAKKKQVKVIVLRTAGTNCDQETAYAFSHFGAKCELVHIHQLIHQEVDLNDFHILAIPGGFTYGDNIESGRILANELTLYLGRSVERFLKKKRLVIGICNGFQVLVKAGILPGSLKKGEQGKRAFLLGQFHAGQVGGARDPLHPGLGLRRRLVRAIGQPQHDQRIGKISPFRCLECVIPSSPKDDLRIGSIPRLALRLSRFPIGNSDGTQFFWADESSSE